ncbi:precorrin-2 C(20)-methyltransferase [Atribacter laminatus]|uniref:Cobalt-precorrin-2 C(20)-methyltransferase n=1 Tax=Atribacter laminatus TaxID=2847778 RepID=A0A7T1F3W7_ATRLM|nr:precorrin-2 C(20)-methyltransferase [Atribacter laminatus]QPM68830.1 Cobalt-precorrin-2 C(20)-methyltransferase [Atribacter laminatus]
MKLSVVGLGPGDPELVTVKAKKVIENSQLIFVPSMKSDLSSRAYHTALPYISKSVSIVPLYFPYFSNPRFSEIIQSNIDSMMTKLKLYDQAAFLIIGDPFLYSSYFQLHQFLQEQYPEIKIDIIPGLSAYQLALSRLQIPAVGNNQTLSVITGDVNHEKISSVLGLSDTVVIYKINQIANLAHFESQTREFSVRKICCEIGTDQETIRDLNHKTALDHYGYFSSIILKKTNL